MLNILVHKLWRICVHIFQFHNIGIHSFLWIIFFYGFSYHFLFVVFLILYVWYIQYLHHIVFLSVIVLISFNMLHVYEKEDRLDDEAFIYQKEVFSYQVKYYIKVEGKRYVFYGDIDQFTIGDHIKISGIVKAFSRKTRPFGFDLHQYYLSQHIMGEIDVEEVEFIRYQFHINQLRYKIMSLFDHYKSKHIIYAFFFNEAIEDESEINWQYLFRISGLHMFLFIEILQFIFKKNSMHPLVAVGIASIFWYLQDYHVSMMRLLLYYSLNSILLYTQYSIHKTIKWMIIWCIQLMFFPYLIFHTGLLMTYGIVLGVAISLDRLKKISKVYQIILMSMMVQSIMLLVSHEINLLHIILSPIIFIITLYGIFPLTIITMSIPNLDHLLYQFYQYINLFFDTFDHKLWKIPIQALPEILVYLYIGIILYIGSSINSFQFVKRFLIGLIFLMVSTYQWNIDHIDIYFLDVSQGDATIIHSQECVIVIDAFNYVSETLKGLGEKNIDYLFITHDDLDHNKELPIIMHNFNVKNFISHPYSSYPYRNMMHVSIPQKITCHNIEIEIISPNKDYLNDNDNSLILLLTIYQHKFLFLGDASKEVEMDIMNAYADHINNVTILKIGHHGSKTSSDLNFLLHVNPIYALISVGRFNRYGMPHQEVLDNLNVTNTTTLRTDQLGTIIFTIHQDELNYAYMKP